MITVEPTDTGLRIHVPNGEVPSERLNAFVDWLRLEAIASRSQLSEADAGRLAEEMKAGWWAANKDRFIKPGGA